MKLLAALLFLLPLGVRAAEDAPTVCRTHLRNLGGAVKAYRLIHDDKPPARLSDLYVDGLIDNYSDFTCPATGTTIRTTAEIDAKTDYTFAALPGTTNLLVRERVSHHGEPTVLAIFGDGAIATIPTGDAPPVAPAVVSQPTTTQPAAPAAPAVVESPASSEPPEFSLIPPGTQVPAQSPPPPAPALGSRPVRKKP